MAPLRFIRYILEVLGLLAGFIIVPLLPRSAVVAFARAIGFLSYKLSKRDRLTAEANVRLAFGRDLTDEKLRAIVKESFLCAALVLLDLFWFSFRSRKRIAKYVRVEDGHDWAYEGKPFLYLTAHFGNWEIFGQVVAFKSGRLLSVAAPLDNPLADRTLNRMRSGTGQTIISKYGAVRGMLRHLKQNGLVALVIDQNTLPKDGGCFVELFGVPVPMSMAAANLLLRCGYDSGFAYSAPDGKGYYDTRMIETFPADECKGLTQEQLTARVAAALEKAVRLYPGSWLWAYKRWKYIPEGQDESKFPFYSRPV
jgi:KDO2-lipid IV(A) lauroyltransferase